MSQSASAPSPPPPASNSSPPPAPQATASSLLPPGDTTSSALTTAGQPSASAGANVGPVSSNNSPAGTANTAAGADPSTAAANPRMGTGMMDPYGYGDPYGGMYGMGGMGGMYGMGGLGMGMGMGMGMGGLGMMGMTPEAQRSQMMMFMINQMVSLWGMFSQVVQVTFGSIIQFIGNYVGINQRLGQIEEESMTLEQQHMVKHSAFHRELADLPESEQHMRHRFRPRVKKPSAVRRFVFGLLRRAVILLLSYYIVSKFVGWYNLRQAKKLSESTALAMESDFANQQ